MGQLTNQFVSQSYQGLLNLANANTGFTANLQTITDGLGGSSPLQMSQTQVNISGTFTVNGQPVAADTGSLVTTSSFNAFTSSIDARVDALEVETGSLQNQINGLATTGSLSGYTTVTVFNNYTSSNDSKVNSLIAGTGSYATTSSLTSLSQSIAATDLAQNNTIAGLATTSSLTSLSSSIASTDLSQNNRLTALEGVTGSINRNGLITTGSIGGTQSITGSLDVQGTISATSASFTYVTTVYETASVIYSSGSNQLGDASNDTQTLWGTVVLPSGPLSITGSLRSTGEIRTDAGVVVGTTLLVNNIENPAGSGDITINTGPFFKVAIDGDTEVTGTLKVTNGITGSLEGTASNAVSASQAQNAVTASYALNAVIPAGTISGSAQIVDLGFATTGSVNQKLDTGSFNSYTSSNDSKVNSLIAATSSYVTEAESGSFMTTGSVAGNVLTFTKGDGSTFNLSVDTGSVTPINTGSFATTGSNVFIGNQVLTGSFSQTGSMTIRGNSGNPSQKIVTIGDPAYGVVEITNNGQLTATNVLYATSIQNWNTVGNIPIDVINPLGSINLLPKTVAGNVNLGANTSSVVIVSGSMDVKGGNLDLFSNNTTVNTDLYLTSSQGGQANIIQGWGDNPQGGAGAVQANYSSSLRITGSNNTVSMPQIRATAIGGGADLQGYISGSGNIITSNFAGIFLNTGSLLFPKTQGNILGNGSSIQMNFTTSSLAGGHPIVGNNLILGGNITLNSNSGSLSANGNAILGGQITSTQNFVTNVRPSIAQNNIIGNVTLNHLSSSINFFSNYNNATVNVNNAVSSSGIAANTLTVSNNAFLGGTHNIFASGSQNSNTSRQITGNLIGGVNTIISSSFVSSSNSNLFSTIAYGANLAVSASHNAGTGGGSAFFGRNNDTGALALAQDIVFAVGTGTGTANRRTGLYVTSGSLVGVSGSMLVNGQTTMTASSGFPLYVSGTMQTQRLHFDGNPFNTNPSSNLGAIRMAGDNQTFQYTNYDLAQIATQSFIDQIVNTGSLTTQTRFGSRYAGTEVKIETINNNGSRLINLISDVTTITGSLNVTGSVSIADAGDLTMYGHKMFNVGTFYDTTTQSGSAAVSQSINFNTTDISQGVTVASNSRLTLANAGTYNIQFSAQLLADTGADNVWIWLKKNGTNVSDSAGKITLANNEALIATWNYVVTASPSDYFEIVWQNLNGDAVILAETASGNIPSIPSIITTVTQVR